MRKRLVNREKLMDGKEKPLRKAADDVHRDAEHPKNRKPEEVTGAVAFPASEDASFIAPVSRLTWAAQV